MFSTITDAITYIDKGINLHASQAVQTNPTGTADGVAKPL
jgi:hypothetical protein